ncbi:hypothetical protein [Priestia megaterium]|uniref:hypothetical protein n=1 Tax=Priestia megaterium TaxID=1404 RepID=UPI002E1DE523|nr:hypothetical protein [Priestia megaterium]
MQNLQNKNGAEKNEIQLAQTNYEVQVKETIINSLHDAGKGGEVTRKEIDRVVKEYQIDKDDLITEARKKINEKPTISDTDLAIQLLNKVAKNKKYKKMSKIAQEMLNEKWWTKYE